MLVNVQMIISNRQVSSLPKKQRELLVVGNDHGDCLTSIGHFVSQVELTEQEELEVVIIPFRNVADDVYEVS